ncbi:TPA: hypothetical protein R2K76_004466 [Raoultella ornithinolytica]|nr:hypothetical protein [Raoultella ornithinolytica]
MAITDTQQAAQFSASAAVSAAEAKQYALSIEKPLIDISESVSEAKDAAASSELARDEAKDIASGLSESINFELAEKEAEFESQMQGQRTAFDVSQQDKESDFLSSQSQREADFVESQTDRENRFQTFLDSSGYVFLGDYEDGPFQFSARNQYIRYDNQYYRLNAATDVGFTTTGTTAASFANDVTHFVLMDGDTLRQNLGSGEEGMGGDLVQANQTYTISDILRRMRTLGDIGAGRPVWGYDTSNDEKIYNAQAGEGADDIMMNGGFFLARKFRGTSRFAVVSGIRGGRASVDDSGAFRAQVVSVSSSLGIANYGLHDGVSDYADALLPALESWETVASATYTASTVTISPETYSETLKNILKGDVIRTRHSSRYWGTVQSVNPQTGVITVDMWALKDNPNLTPENDGSGFYLNFIDKVWADNKNVIIRPNSAGLYANVGEFGALVQKAGMGYVNGMDMVLLSGSTQDATAAYLARSGASGFAWLYGFSAQGNRFNFYSLDGMATPYAGFMENSNAIIGMKFRDKNTYSLAWSKSTDLTAVGPSSLTAIIGPAGHVFRKPERIITLSASGMLDQFFPTVYVVTAGIIITMPDINQMPVSGYVFKVRLFLAGTYTFNTYQGQTTINGNPQLTVTTTAGRQTIEIQFDGTFWQAFTR